MTHPTLPIPFLFNFPIKQALNNFLFPSAEIQRASTLHFKNSSPHLLNFIIPAYEYSFCQFLPLTLEFPLEYTTHLL